MAANGKPQPSDDLEPGWLQACVPTQSPAEAPPSGFGSYESPCPPTQGAEPACRPGRLAPSPLRDMLGRATGGRRYISCVGLPVLGAALPKARRSGLRCPFRVAWPHASEPVRRCVATCYRRASGVDSRTPSRSMQSRCNIAHFLFELRSLAPRTRGSSCELALSTLALKYRPAILGLPLSPPGTICGFGF